jgi:glycosyltransferase involved in cell wall biosynthesis
MIKVLIVIGDLGVAGGIEQSNVELLPRLPAFGIEPTVVVFSPSARDEQFRARGVSVELARGDQLGSRLGAIRSVFRRCSPDVVQLSDQKPGWHLPTRLAGLLAGIPLLTSLTNYPAAVSPDYSARRRVLVTVDDWTTLRLTQHFHAVSHAVKASWVHTRAIRADRITVVERGRDRQRLGFPSQERRAAARAALGIAPQAKVLLTVGRQAVEKGQIYLVDAFERVATRWPEAQLLIAGDPSTETVELQARRAARGTPDRIRLLGQRDDVPDLLAASDVFVFPSLREGFGGAMVEAMAMGLPVVASDIGPLREIVDHGRSGLLVPPRDSGALAEAIQRILGAPALGASLGAQGRRRFEARYTIERCVPRMATLYRHVASRARSRIDVP